MLTLGNIYALRLQLKNPRRKKTVLLSSDSYIGRDDFFRFFHEVFKFVHAQV